MKCMQAPKEGDIVRISDDKAIELQKRGWKFIPKSEWKSAPNTTWKKASVPPNPMNEKKRFRQEKRNHTLNSR